MNKNKLEIFQRTSKTNNTYMIYRYFDNKNNNYEYQIYKLVQSKPVAREFGVSETKSGRVTKLNSREMCDLMIEEFEKKNY